MTLTREQKQAIIAEYAPILIYHPEEAFVPVKPEVYMESSALWDCQPPSDNKEFWGNGGPEGDKFPRYPTIPQGGISVSPGEDTNGTADPDGDTVNEWYLGHVSKDGIQPYLVSHEGSERFLEFGGWAGSQEVSRSSDNSSCNKQDALDRWRQADPEGTAGDWYYADVSEQEDIDRFLLALGVSAGDIKDLIRGVVGDIWIVWYYFFYPIHEEHLKRCEAFLDSTNRGDYEGDWNAVGVVVHKPLVLPWEEPGTPLPTPSHVGLGVRLRGISEEIFESMAAQGMVVRSWTEIGKIDRHPRLFVSKGYHNFYSTPGAQNPPQFKILGVSAEKLTCGPLEQIQSAKEDFEEFLDDVGGTIEDIGITIMKGIAGAGIGAALGGPLGAGLGFLSGLIAGVVEGILGSDAAEGPSDEVMEAAELEQGPPKEGFGLVLKPASVEQPIFPTAKPPEAATEIRIWNGTEAQRLVDYQNQIWWPTNPVRQGYDGRWGTRCTNDPLERRSGITFPEFGPALLNDLAIHISETS